MKQIVLYHQRFLVRFSISVMLCCLAFNPSGRAEKQKPIVRPPMETTKQKGQTTNTVKAKKPSTRLEHLYHSWVRNKKRTENDAPKKQTGEQPPASATRRTPEAPIIGAQTPQLSKPFYADIYRKGESEGMRFGIQGKDGTIYALEIEKEVTAEGTSNTIGVSVESDIDSELDKLDVFFSRTRDVLLFVPKKIGTGVRYLGRGIKSLRWW